MALYAEDIKALPVGTKFRFEDYPEGAYGVRTEGGVELFGPPPGSYETGMFAPDALISAIFDDPNDDFSSDPLIII